MREIKFRAWYPGNKSMAKDYWGGDVDTTLNEMIVEAKKEKVILMQFTGLKDKNGKEIYEGDIVKGEQIDYVRWNSNLCVFVPLLVFGENKVEVIGNKYENPELLK